MPSSADRPISGDLAEVPRNPRTLQCIVIFGVALHAMRRRAPSRQSKSPGHEGASESSTQPETVSANIRALAGLLVAGFLSVDVVSLAKQRGQNR